MCPLLTCPVGFFKLPDLEDLMKREKQSILTPLVSLDTPGKATVQVVILADPVSITQQGTGCPRDFVKDFFSILLFSVLYRMDMKFALLGMKLFENFLRWIQKETNYWTM